eukprot:scaffold165879_cov43-Attheya_sp.AAC.1
MLKSATQDQSSFLASYSIEGLLNSSKGLQQKEQQSFSDHRKQRAKMLKSATQDQSSVLASYSIEWLLNSSKGRQQKEQQSFSDHRS